MRDDANVFPDGGGAKGGNLLAEQTDLSGSAVVEPGDQAGKCRFAGAGPADDADGLAGHDTKIQVMKGFGFGAPVGKAGVAELKGRRICIVRCGKFQIRSCFRNGWDHVENGVDPRQTGHGLGQQDNQIGELHQFCQDLRHIIDQGDDLSLGQPAGIHLEAAVIQDGNNPQVNDHISEGVQKSRDLTDEDLLLIERRSFLTEMIHFFILPGECPYHPDAQQVFPGA